MATEIKQKNIKASDIALGVSTRIGGHKNFLREFEAVVRTNHIFASDELSLSSFCCVYFMHLGLTNKYERFIKLNIETHFGCTFPSEFFDKPACDAFDYLVKNRTTPVRIPQQPFPHFLGIKNFKALDTGEFLNIGYAFGLKDQVEYFSGWIMGKSNPLNGTTESKKQIIDEFEQFKAKVYGKPEHPIWEISTEEGDILKFNNLYDVCCWVIARCSNYSPEEMTKENW